VQGIGLAIAAIFVAGAVPSAPVFAASAGPAFSPTDSQNLPAGANGRLDFTTILIPAAVTIRAQPADFSDGLRLFASSDIHVHGLLDASGVDLTIETPGSFVLHTGGGFLADDFTIDAGTVRLEGIFRPVAGGHVQQDASAGGSVTLSGHGSTMTMAVAVPIALEHFVYESPWSSLPIVGPFETPQTPLPPALFLLGGAFGSFAFARRRHH
jgi:hypothetical protein